MSTPESAPTDISDTTGTPVEQATPVTADRFAGSRVFIDKAKDNQLVIQNLRATTGNALSVKEICEFIKADPATITSITVENSDFRFSSGSNANQIVANGYIENNMPNLRSIKLGNNTNVIDFKHLSALVRAVKNLSEIEISQSPAIKRQDLADVAKDGITRRISSPNLPPKAGTHTVLPDLLSITYIQDEAQKNDGSKVHTITAKFNGADWVINSDLFSAEENAKLHPAGSFSTQYNIIAKAHGIQPKQLSITGLVPKETLPVRETGSRAAAQPEPAEEVAAETPIRHQGEPKKETVRILGAAATVPAQEPEVAAEVPAPKVLSEAEIAELARQDELAEENPAPAEAAAQPAEPEVPAWKKPSGRLDSPIKSPFGDMTRKPVEYTGEGSQPRGKIPTLFLSLAGAVAALTVVVVATYNHFSKDDKPADKKNKSSAAEFAQATPTPAPQVASAPAEAPVQYVGTANTDQAFLHSTPSPTPEVRRAEIVRNADGTTPTPAATPEATPFVAPAIVKTEVPAPAPIVIATPTPIAPPVVAEQPTPAPSPTAVATPSATPAVATNKMIEILSTSFSKEDIAVNPLQYNLVSKQQMFYKLLLAGSDNPDLHQLIDKFTDTAPTSADISQFVSKYLIAHTPGKAAKNDATALEHDLESKISDNNKADPNWALKEALKYNAAGQNR